MYGIYYVRSGPRMWLVSPEAYHSATGLPPKNSPVWSSNPAFARRFDSPSESRAAVASWPLENDRWADEPTLVGRLPGGNGRG